MVRVTRAGKHDMLITNVCGSRCHGMGSIGACCPWEPAGRFGSVGNSGIGGPGSSGMPGSWL
ncbi:MAG TPA: hypothetical protein PLF11_13735, partial [Bacillota bacterium]|nr:hypothetical protein [Bacillota bacterium]